MTRIASSAALLLLFGLPFAAFATNGYFAHGFSATQKAMGGAGTAYASDALSVTVNPASMVWVGDGFEVGLSMFTPIRDYRASERGENASNGIFAIDPIDEHRSHNEYFPLPAVAYNRAWGDKASWGIAMFGNGGMNTEYIGSAATFGQGLTGFQARCNGAFGGGTAIGQDNAGFCGEAGRRVGVDLAILFLAPSVSYRLGESNSIGFSPLLTMSRFAAQGLGAFAQFSNAPDKVSDNGHELAFGGGYRLGWLSKLLPGVTFGSSYQSRIWMQEFDDYAGLFAEQGDFDVPETWNAGVSLKVTENQRLLVDFQRINYSDIASVGLPLNPNNFVNNCAIPRLLAGFGVGQASESAACLGSSTGPGFGWQDMEVWKFGYQYSWRGHQLRLGYSRTDQPIPESEVLFNVLAPGVIEEHFTAGVSIHWSKNFYVDVALMYAPNRPVSGKNPLSNTDANLLGLLTQGTGLGAVGGLVGQDTSQAFGADPDDQTLILNMRQYEATIGFGWRY